MEIRPACAVRGPLKTQRRALALLHIFIANEFVNLDPLEIYSAIFTVAADQFFIGITLFVDGFIAIILEKISASALGAFEFICHVFTSFLAAGHYAPPYLKLGLLFRLRITICWNSVGSGYSLGFS